MGDETRGGSTRQGAWDPRRVQIRDLLRRDAPPLAELYEGAVVLMSAERPIPGRLRFVCHAVREIRNRLPEVLAHKVRARIDYRSLLDDLAERWQSQGPSEWRSEDEASTNATTVAVDATLVHEISRLLATHVESRETRNEAARRLFLAVAPDGAAHPGVGPAVEHWLSVTEWFMQRTHVGVDIGVRKTADGERLSHQFQVFEDALAALTTDFYTTMDRIDDLLDRANA